MTRLYSTAPFVVLALVTGGCFEDPTGGSGSESPGDTDDTTESSSEDGTSSEEETETDTTSETETDTDTDTTSETETETDTETETETGEPNPCPELPATILYDQELDFGSMAQWQSQVSSNPPFVFEPADDVPIPDGECWCVTQVVAFGNYWDTMGDDTLSRVSFYESDPLADPVAPVDAPFFSQEVLADEALGSLSVEFDEPVVLDSGRNWLSFNRVMDVNPNNLRWYWSAAIDYPETASFRFRAAGNTQSECDDWQYPDVCANFDPGFDDFAFQIWGVHGTCE